MKEASHKKYEPTAEFAKRFFVKPDTVRKSYCLYGHYQNVIPKKLSNGRLAWPMADT